jgi:predicted RNA-binding Zn-ribbon protein involved in translation (DUF1610 family)
MTERSAIMEQEIVCPHCGRSLGPQSNFTFLYMPNDIRCPNCGRIVIHTNTPKF